MIRARLVAFLAFVALALCGPAGAGAAPATVEVFPASSELSAGHRTGLRVVVTNTTDRPLQRVVVRALHAGAANLDFTVQRREPLVIPPGYSRTWRLTVERAARQLSAERIEVLARFRTVSGKGVKGAGVVHASAELKPPSVPDASAVASFELLAALKTLKSGKTEHVYLTFTNKTAVKLTAGPIEASKPGFLSVSGGEGPFVVLPGETRVIALDVSADDSVRPGTYQLVFTTPVTVGETEQRFTLTASKAVDVAVEGESELLTALGVPTLFLLPGFLVLATMSLLWRTRLLRKKWDSDAFFLEVKSAEFWVAAVVISFVIVFGWSQVAGDLLDQYGLEDIVGVWIASILLGVAFYVAHVLVRNHNRESTTPNTGDGPLETLEKLHNQGLDLVRERRDYLDPGGARTLYAIQSLDEDRPATWMSPAIDFEGPENDTDLADRIAHHLKETHDAGSLAAVLREGEKAEKVKVRWSTDAAPVTGPRLIDKDKIGGEHEAESIVHKGL
jgi:hypothetical protein